MHARRLGQHAVHVEQAAADAVREPPHAPSLRVPQSCPTSSAADDVAAWTSGSALRVWDGVDFTGWWVYVVGDLVGVCIAVTLINVVRGMPNKAEIRAAEGSLQ